MRKDIPLLAVIAAVTFCRADTTAKKAEKRLQASAEILHEIMEAPDKGIPKEVLEGAKCIAVVPHEIKGGLVFGAAHGRGVTTCRTPTGWSAPAFFSITGGSWGAQIGLEGVDNVLAIMNQKGMDRLLSDKFQIGGEASAAAGPVGRHAAAETDWKLDAEILSYSRAKGAFAGATLNGAWVSPDREATRAFYGRDLSSKEILTGQVPAPAKAQTFLAAIHDAEREARKVSRSVLDPLRKRQAVAYSFFLST
jgi:lipid-binding SYLF domain-containing protein